MRAAATIACLVALSLSLSACKFPTDQEIATVAAAKAKRDAASFITEIVYQKDARTGLCFAVVDVNAPGQTMATVPCTPAVEALIGEAE